MVKKSDCFVQTSKKMSIPVQDQNLAQQLACEHSTFNIIDFANMDVGQPFQSWKCKEGPGRKSRARMAYTCSLRPVQKL